MRCTTVWKQLRFPVLQRPQLPSSSLLLFSRNNSIPHYLVSLNSKCFVTVSSLVIATTITTTATTQCLSKKKSPPRYGTTIPKRLLSTDSRETSLTVKALESVASKEQKEDCPICKKFSSGPCGSIFQRWRDCIDENTNSSDKCDALVKELSVCLQQHQDYYDTYEEDDHDENTIELKSNWEDFINQLESTQQNSIVTVTDNTDMEPCMQVRLKTKTGIVEFFPSFTNKQNLLMGYVKDDDTNQLLGAGSSTDLFVLDTNKLVLRFGITNATRTVTAYAIYGVDDNDGSNEQLYLFKKTQRIPLNDT